VVYWCNSYTIVHCSLDIIEWFKYKLKKVFKLYLILIHPPLSINIHALVQGHITVEEYEIRFMELVKYVSYMDKDQL
jgi:hypothetical protein